ncbi:hypothetical protein [uncultured Bacteroides sp.]|uniref:hypothetical protein n=1 Tax=uncultured Bacteroides sp. TaxID=162156 RepID=UPI0026102E4C|nr:hypothetical protein [uncultured Bacteroides sp.]
MKHVEAISLCADLQKRVIQLRLRQSITRKYRKVMNPARNMEELFKELNDILVQSEELI